MIKFAADEDFHNDIKRGLRRRVPDVDIMRVQDVGLSGAPDPDVLAWAAMEDRVLLTHDVSTMTYHAYERLIASQPMAGVFEIARSAPIGPVVEDLVLLYECSSDGEWDGKIEYLPFG